MSVPVPAAVVHVGGDLEEECHDLVDVHDLQGVQLVAGLEVGTPGEPDGLHHVGEQVVQLNLGHYLLYNISTEKYLYSLE